MRKYETFLEFLLDGRGDENTAIEHGVMERISADSHRIVLTDAGSDLLLERLSVFFNSGQELSSEQILLTSEFLYFGQLFGGGSFVELFRAKFSVHFLNNLAEKFGGELTEAEKERNNAFESPYEAEWRIRLYTECIDIASGYETYMLYQPSTLCFESCRVLSSKLFFLLSALLLCDCEQFAVLSKEKQNPVWTLLIIDRFQGSSLPSQVLSDDLATVITHLNNDQRGVLIAHYWQSVESRCVMEFDQGLANVLQRLMPQESLQILARITSDLSRESFPNMFGGNREKHSEQRKILNTVIRWLAGWLNASGVEEDTVIENYVNNLYGRVNSEEKWVGLLLAKELQSIGDPYALNLAAAIRKVIIGDYPKYWEKGAGKDSELYFSGEQSLALIEELADALFLQGEAIEVLAWLSNVKEVASPAKLWVQRLVKAREYETVIEVLDGINVDNLQGEQFTGWKMLKAHAVLQEAFLAEQIDDQIKSLHAVLKVLNFPRKNGQYEGNSEDVKILKLQVMGWLVDRGAMDTVELMNAYNMISIIDAVNGKWDLGIYSEGRQYVCALSLVRILNHLPVESKNIREEEMGILWPLPLKRYLNKLSKVPAQDIQ